MSSVAPDFSTSTATRQFAYGFGLLFRAAVTMIRTPSLWPWIAFPIALTMLLLTGSAWLTWSHGTDITSSMLAWPQSDGVAARLGAAAWHVANVVVHVVVFFVLAAVSWLLGNALASPFYERMSAAVEVITRGRVNDEVWDTRQMLLDLAASVVHTGACLMMYLSLACPAALLNLIPVVGQVAAFVLGTGFAAFFMAREVLDHPMSRRRFSLRRKLGLCRAHLWPVLGLGTGIVLLLGIPLANFLSMPAAVIAGTMLYLDLQEAGMIAEDAPPSPLPSSRL
jgi:CysZ protein